MATKANKIVKVEDSKIVNNAVDNFDAPVMDWRILKLNEYKAVKMSAISSKKRPAAKEAKELATYILNNWDNLAELKNIKAEDVVEGDIWNIIVSRLKNFEDAIKASEEAIIPVKLNINDIVNNKDNKLTAKEIVLLNVINESPDVSFGEEYSALDCNDVAKIIKWDVKTVKGVLGSLVKKNILSTYDTGTGYEVIIFVQQQIMTHENLDEKVLAEALLNSEEKKAEPAKADKAPTKKEAKKADKVEQPKEKKAKTARKVGDVHPNHPTWIWTEYAEGKFDWRTNPADKKQGQRTDKATTSAKKSEPKKDTKKATNKKVAKGVKVEKEAPKELTIDEFVALPSKSARGNKKPSEAQKEALKLIMKGYRVTADHKFFENADGDKKACNWDSVVAMLRRYGMEYIPVGLVK